MNLVPFTGLLLTLLQGYFLAALLLPDPSPGKSTAAPSSASSLRWVRMAMVMPLGFGLTSLIYFAWRSAFGPVDEAYIAFELAVLLALMALYIRAGLLPRLRVPAPPRPSRPGLWQVLLPAAYVLGMCGLVGATLLGGALFRSGTAQAWSTWNLGARFLVHGGEPWTNLFSPLLPQPDNPLLYSASVARMWIFQAREAEWAPISTGLIYGLSASLLVAAGVTLRRGLLVGCAAGLAVLGASALVVMAPAQTADLLLAYYLLAAGLCIYLIDIGYTNDYRTFTLAGFFAGLALWTSNSAWYFLIALVAARLVWLRRNGNARRALPGLQAFLVGLLPLVVYILLFRLVLIPNVPTLDDITAFLDRLFSLPHLLDVSRVVALQLVEVDPRRAVPFLALLVFLLLAGLDRRARLRLANRLLFYLLLVSAGFFLFSVLVSAPDPLVSLRTLAARRLLSLWPLAVLLVFLVVRLPGIAVERGLPARATVPRSERPPQ